MTNQQKMSDHILKVKQQRVSRCSEVWREIHSRSAYRSPFTSYGWFAALCTHLIEEDPDVFLFLDADTPVAIMPAVLKGEQVTFLADRRITDLIDMICLSGYEDLVCKTIGAYLAAHQLNIDLAPLEKNSPLVMFLPRHLKAIHVEDADACPLLTLPASWNGYMTMLSGKNRHELKRKLRKGQEIETHRLDADGIAILFALMIASDARKASFLTESVRAFMMDIAKIFQSRHWLRLCVSYFQARPIGVLFSFNSDRHIYLYNSGFDPHYSRFSPGIVSIARDLESAIAEGFTHYDFLRGDETYKLHFGASIRHTVRIRA